MLDRRVLSPRLHADNLLPCGGQVKNAPLRMYFGHLHRAASVLQSAAVIGLDCEWKPRLLPGEKSSPAELLQARPFAASQHPGVLTSGDKDLPGCDSQVGKAGAVVCAYEAPVVRRSLLCFVGLARRIRKEQGTGVYKCFGLTSTVSSARQPTI